MAANIHVNGEIPVPPDELWKLVADFGNVGWIPGGENVKLEGSGPGMIRYLGENNEIHETLESVDEAGRSVTYTIPVGLPFPASSYRSTMKVSDAGNGNARLDWSCESEPKGVSAEELEGIIGGMYQTMIGWITDYVKK